MTRRALRVLPALVLLAGCEIPTDAPIWDMTWNVPAKSTDISVTRLLPAGVTPGANNTFQASVTPVTITRTLAQDCAACAAANGQNTPKPAFTGAGTGSATLPSSVASAALAAGNALTVNVTHNYTFDPLRPNGATAPFGWLRIVVTSGTTVIGRDSINGATTALPAGTIVRNIPLTGNVSGAGGITVSTTLESPAGANVTMDASRTMTFTATAANNAASFSTATVNFSNVTVTKTSTAVDLSDVDGSIRDRVNSGEMILTINNPVGATGTLSLAITGGSSPVTKSVALAAGTSTVRIAFTGDELRAILGRNVSFDFTGTVNGTNLTINPSQVLGVGARFQLNISTESK